MSFSPRQCKAARDLLGWTQEALAKKADVGTKTIADFERGQRQPYRRTMRDLRLAFEAAGIIFVAEGEVSPAAGEGVRLSK